MEFPGFVGPSYQLQSLNAGVERCVNLYAEKMEVPGADPAWTYYGTPGLTLLLTCPDAPIRAQYFLNGRAFAVAGAGLYETTSGAAVFLGAVLNDGQPASMASNGVAGGQLFVVSGGSGYILTLTTNAFAVIAAAGFPTGTAMQAGFLDGYFLVLAPTKFQVSALEDGTTWPAAQVAQRSIAADSWVSMLVLPRFVWLFGTQTSEVWYDVGATFPFAPLGNVLVPHGIAAIWSAAPVDNSVAWLARNVDGDRMVLLADQYVPKRISTHAVETALMTCADVSDFLGFSYQEQGHNFYLLTSRANKMTWAYDAATGLWHERGWWNTTTGEYEAIRARNHIAPFGQHWVGDRETGAIYQQALGTYTEAGIAIRSLRRFPHLIAELNRMYYSSLQLNFQPGTGLVDGTDPQIMLRWSDDGGYTWSNESWLSGGLMGQMSTRAIWRRLGYGRNRVFEIVQTTNVKRAWLAAYLNAQPGTS